MLLAKEVAHEVIAYGISLGADFCDLFVEKTSLHHIDFKSSNVKDITSGIDSGVGVRLIFGNMALYAYSNSFKKEDLLDMTKKLSAQLKVVNPKTLSQSFNFTPVNYKIISSIKNKDVALNDKVARMHKLDQLIRSKSPKVTQASLGIMQKEQQVEIFNSDGLHAFENRPYIRLYATAISSEGSKNATGSFYPGRRGGYEFFENYDLHELSDYVVSQASNMLEAQACPAGKMPVLIENGFGGVIFHEACGHLLETTAVEKKASVFWDKKGEQIANVAVSAVDDGTNDNMWGSLSIDDEGMPTQKTQLIKNGILTNFICDKIGNMITEHPRTGSGRKQNYRYAPASRMRNTYIDKGQSTLDDMLTHMQDGIYAKAMGGGSVDPGTGEFNFAVTEGYLVKNGKIAHPVKGATLIGKGSEILNQITMVGNNLELAAGMCGSVSGAVPTTVGQPALLVEGILVGGQA